MGLNSLWNSASGVCPTVRSADLIVSDLRVDLRRRDVRVTQERLHASQVGAPAEQVSGERVAQLVRMHPGGEPGAKRMADAASVTRGGK